MFARSLVGALALVALVASSAIAAQPPAAQPIAQPAAGLYVKTFGDPARPAIVFVHGGPGSNCASFEYTAAQALARDHYVVVYDQAGCGRSAAPASADAYDFAHAADELRGVIRRTGAKQPLLLGHSFGGTIALEFLQRFPSDARGVVLVSSPIDYPSALKTIMTRSRRVYQAFKNTQGVARLDALAHADPSSAAYAGELFAHASFCGLYAPAHPTAAALAAYAQLRPYGALVMDLKNPPFVGFVQHEHYTTMRLNDLVRSHRDRIAGIYGAEDWTLDGDTRAFLGKTLPAGRFVVLDQASHGVFVDREDAFVRSLDAIEASFPARQAPKR